VEETAEPAASEVPAVEATAVTNGERP
jgi:hypothetical protein